MKNNRRTIGILFIILLIINLMNGGLSNPADYFYNILISLPGIVIGLSFHEFGHAFVSYRLGDPTPKEQGRVTLNPKAHFDPFGFLALVFCGFGWGIPVEINPRNYKHPRRDEFLVSIAGVTMNFILAIVFAIILRIMYSNLSTTIITNSGLVSTLFYILLQCVIINIILGVFNLIPCPPLDGFGIITQLFNLKKYNWFYTFYNNGYPLLMILLITGVINRILNPIVSFIYNGIFYGIVLG